MVYSPATSQLGRKIDTSSAKGAGLDSTEGHSGHGDKHESMEVGQGGFILHPENGELWRRAAHIGRADVTTASLGFVKMAGSKARPTTRKRTSAKFSVVGENRLRVEPDLRAGFLGGRGAENPLGDRVPPLGYSDFPLPSDAGCIHTDFGFFACRLTLDPNSAVGHRAQKAARKHRAAE